MIEINLLPPDRRPVERTPLPRFLVLVAGVVLITLELFYGAYLWVIEVPKTRSQLRDVERMRDELEQDAAMVDKLEQDIQRFSDRYKAVMALITKRNQSLWSPLLDQLDEPEVLPENVWLTSFTYKPSRGSMPGTAVMKGYVRGNERERTETLALFLRNLQNNPYFSKMFPEIKLKEFKVDELNPGTEAEAASARPLPKEALAFEIELTMKPPVQPKKKKKRR